MQGTTQVHPAAGVHTGSGNVDVARGVDVRLGVGMVAPLSFESSPQPAISTPSASPRTPMRT